MCPNWSCLSGPFNFIKPTTKGTLPTLQLNPYSWSKVRLNLEIKEFYLSL